MIIVLSYYPLCSLIVFKFILFSSYFMYKIAYLRFFLFLEVELYKDNLLS